MILSHQKTCLNDGVKKGIKDKLTFEPGLKGHLTIGLAGEAYRMRSREKCTCPGGISHYKVDGTRGEEAVKD